MTESTEAPKNRLETILAFMAIGTVGTSIVSMLISLLIRLFTGVNGPTLLVQLPLIGLPVGFILIIALLIVSLRRRARENRGK